MITSEFKKLLQERVPGWADLGSQLTDHEGVHLIAYPCPAGYWTAGVGRNLEARGMTPAAASRVTLDMVTAIEWLQVDLNDAVVDLMRESWFSQLSKDQRAAIIDMRFNLGGPRFRGFKRLDAALEIRDYTAAGREMLDSKWARQVGRRAQTLALMVALDIPYTLARAAA